MSAKERGHTLNGPSGRSHGQLLSSHLKEKRPKQVHRRKLVEPCMRIEVRPSVNELSDHRIHFAEVVLGAPKMCPPPAGVQSRGLTCWHLRSLPSRRRWRLPPTRVPGAGRDAHVGCLRGY